MEHIDLIDRFLGTNKIGDFESLIGLLNTKKYDELTSFCIQMSSTLPGTRKQFSEFNFIADTSQSGLPHPCSGHGCRESKISGLIAYTATFADQMTAVDPFSYIVQRYGPDSSKPQMIDEIAHAVALVIFAAPLIDRKILTFYEFSSAKICRDCYAKTMLSFMRSGKVNDLFFEIMKEYASSTTIFDEGNRIRIQGPEDYIEHGTTYVRQEKENARARRSPKIITARKAVEMGLFYAPAQFVQNDIIQKSHISDQFNISKIFSSTAETSILAKIFGADFASNKFAIDVPFLSSRNVGKILEIREGEWHHFEDFRQAFASVAKQGQPTDLIAALKEMDGEIIKIEKTFRKFAREANRKLVDGIGMGGMTFVASVMTSGISTFLSAAAAVLGSNHFTKLTIPAVRDKLDEPEAIKESRMYFAWKIKKSVGA